MMGWELKEGPEASLIRTREKKSLNPHDTICTLLPPSELKENKISLWTKMNQI